LEHPTQPRPPSHRPPQALEDSANSEIRKQIEGTIKQLKALPKTQQATNGNGNGDGSGEGPAALLARCRELAMQVKVGGRALMTDYATQRPPTNLPLPTHQPTQPNPTDPPT
jgi:hypothetical protein